MSEIERQSSPTPVKPTLAEPMPVTRQPAPQRLPESQPPAPSSGQPAPQPLAIVGIAALFMMPGIGLVVCAVCGAVARKRIAQGIPQIGGSALATTALVIGAAGLAVFVLITALLVAGVFML